MKYGIKDRILDALRAFSDRYNLKKEAWVCIGIAVVLSVGIGAGIAVGVSPNTHDFDSDIDSLGQADDYILTTIDALLGQNADTALAIAGINSTVLEQLSSIDALALLLTGLRAEFDNLICSPPDAYLGGAFGDYTLYVKSSKAGEFTVNVRLVYSPPIWAGNTTNYTAAVEYFCGSINWTEANQVYIPTVAFNGTAWVICQVSFNAGTFTLEAGTEAIIPVGCSGLQHEPAYAYVEVYPAHRG